MIAPKFVPLVLKQVWRHRARSALTVSGIAVAMFLFTAVQSMQRGVREATEGAASETMLIVYRQDRFCPATSRLPEDYAARIGRVEGVEAVIPMKVVVNNCRTSLDVVTFRGVPKESFLREREGKLVLVSGSVEEWLRRTDASLIGETLATRRGLRPGMTFDAAGITTLVAGVVRSELPQDRDVAYASLDFVQQASRSGLGSVTQFSVRVRGPDDLDAVAAAIDAEFARAQEPTTTYTEKAFIGRVAQDVLELVGFARWLGLGCLAAVLALVGNAIALSVQSRVGEHAVMQTLGYRGWLLARLVIAEGVVLAVAGGLVGAALAVGLGRMSGLAISAEGQSIPIEASWSLLATGLAVCAGVGVVAGLVPAARLARREIAHAFRAV